MADQSGQGGGQDNMGDVMYLWKIPIDRGYVKSIFSILKVVIACITVIAFICCASGRSEICDDEYASTYNYFEFVSVSLFLTIIGLWFFFTLTLDRQACFKKVPWNFVELIYLAVYAVFYIIAFICIAAQSCGKDNNKAAAALAFFCIVGIGAHGFFTFKQWRENRRHESATTQPKQTPEYNPDRNMELY